MGNLNIELTGHIANVVDAMITKGYAKTKTEALRLAVFEFNNSHKVLQDEDTAYELITKKILSDVDSGKVKVKTFSLDEL